MAKHFDIKLTNVSEGHIIKDTGRVVITTDPDPLPDPSPENLMVWDCVFFDNKGTRSLNYELKPNHEYAVCVLDSYRGDELFWAYIPFTDFESGRAGPIHFPGLDDFVLYKNGRLYMDSESSGSSKFYRVLERPFLTVSDDDSRTNPGEWTEVPNPGYLYDWESNQEYYFVAEDGDGLFTAHIYTHADWHGSMRRIDPTRLYIGSYRQDHGSRWIQLRGKRLTNDGGSSSDKYITHNDSSMRLLRAYKRPLSLTTNSEVEPHSNDWSHLITQNKYDNGFTVTNFNWQKNYEYLVMGIDDSGDWEIAAGVTIVDDMSESNMDWDRQQGLGNVIGESLWSRFTVESGIKKVRAKNGRLVSVYRRPLYLSDATCGSSSTIPVDNAGNWVVNQIPINPYESTRNVDGTPVSFVSNCGVAIHKNKGILPNGTAGNVNGSILIQVLDRVDDEFIEGSVNGVIQVADFDWDAGTTIVLSVTRTKLTGDLTTVPDSDSLSHSGNGALKLVVDDFDEGIVQFDITATVNQSDGDTIQFGVLQILMNKTASIDSANEYMRPNEKLF